jgi:hypothetical protein
VQSGLLHIDPNFEFIIRNPQLNPPLLASRIPLPDLHEHGQGTGLWRTGQSEVEAVNILSAFCR